MTILSHNTYDSIQTTASMVLSSYYGNAIQSSVISAGASIKTSDWTKLYNDLDACLTHQTGNHVAFPCITTGSIIRQVFVNSLTNVASTVYANRSNAINTQLTSQPTTSVRTTTWGSDIAHRVEYSWNSVGDVAHFFQTGGYIVPSLAIAVNNLSNTLNINWSQLITSTYNDFNFQNYIFDLATYLNPPAAYVNNNINIGTITVTYTFTTPTTLVASIVFHPEGDYLSILVLPTAGFTTYKSSGAVYAPATSVQLIETLDVGGASLYPSLYFHPIAANTVNQLSTGTVSVLVTNSGTGYCSISNLLFTPDPASNFTTYHISISTATIQAGASATLTLQYGTTNSAQGTYNNNSITVVSNNVNGNASATFQSIVTFPIFAVNISPATLTRTLTTSNAVIQNFAFSAGASGVVQSITASLTTNTNFGLYLSQPMDTPEIIYVESFGGFFGGSDFVINVIPSKHFPGSISTVFTPPLPAINYSNTASTVPPPTSITGNYPTQLLATFNPADNRQTPVFVSIPIDYTLNIQNQHLGNWLSPRDYTNAIAGFSYDIIEGQKYLTIGFGMGGDGSPELYNSGTAFVSASTLGIGADVKPGAGIALYPSTTGTHYGSFLQSYGAWITPNGGYGYNTDLIVDYEFFVPISGTYNFEFSADATGQLSINGVLVADWSDPTSSITGHANLIAGINTATIICNAYANSTNQSLYSSGGALSSSTVVYIGPVYETTNNKVSISKGTSSNGLASIGVKISDPAGTVWWSTLTPQRPTLQPAYEFWGEVYRIPISGDARTYNSGDYPVKLTDFAGGRTYGSFCGTGTNAGSAFTIIDDGNGNLNVTFNPWPATASTGFSAVDITLSLFQYLPYYYENILARILNLEAPFDNAQYTHYFTGFGNDGAVRTSTVPFPNPIVINGVLAVAGVGGTQHLSFLQTAVQDLIQVGTIALEVGGAAVGITALAIAAGLTDAIGATVGIAAVTGGSIAGSIVGAATTVIEVLAFCGF